MSKILTAVGIVVLALFGGVVGGVLSRPAAEPSASPTLGSTILSGVYDFTDGIQVNGNALVDSSRNVTAKKFSGIASGTASSNLTGLKCIEVKNASTTNGLSLRLVATSTNSVAVWQIGTCP